MSKIDWTEKTWNPVTGCTKCSPACQNCYAERMAKRLQGTGLPKYRNGYYRVTVNGAPLRHVCRHSPDGFEWGYGGSGPADLARSILIDCLGEERADRLYQDFKSKFVDRKSVV